MIKIIFISLLLPFIFAQCSNRCATCEISNNSYACLSCSPDNTYIYLFSCPNPQNNLTFFYCIAGLITILHIFMILVGQGVYRDIFQNIQLASLVTWRYGFEKGILAIQLTNLGLLKNNSFPSTFGSQFIIIIIFLGVYWVCLTVAIRYPQNPTSVLIRRKKIIFPTRIYTFTFNMLLYSSLVQLNTIKTQQKFKIFEYDLAILAIIFLGVVMIGLLASSNWKRFQVDDPHYYVLLQQMITKKWYAKNNVAFSLIARAIIIIAFVALFEDPSEAGIIMLVAQLLYTFYLAVFLRFVKVRYFVFILGANLLMIGIILVIYIGSVSQIGSGSWDNLSICYQSLCLVLIGLFFFATMSQIIIKKQIITKDIKSFFYRFIKCDKSEQETELASKYESTKNRQKVTEFQTNLLYHKALLKGQIQMTNRQQISDD